MNNIITTISRMTVVICLVSFMLPDPAIVASGLEAAGIDRYDGWSLQEVKVRDLSREGGDKRVVKMPTGSKVAGVEIEEVLSTLMTDYRDAAYLLSEIEDISLSVDSLSRSVALSISIDRGPLCHLSAINLEGNRSLTDEEFADITGLLVGSSLAEKDLRGGLESVVHWYRDNGYPYAEVAIEEFIIDPGGGVRMTLALREKKRVRIGRVTVEGNELTRDDVVLRQFGIGPGDSFSSGNLEAGRERLMMSGLFSGVGDVSLVKSDNPYKVDLNIVVEEGKPNLINGAAGLIPGVGGKMKPTGTLHLVLGNLWGTGRRAEARWMGRGEGVSQLDLRYREPWIGGSPLSAEFSFTQELRDTVFNRLEFEFAGIGNIGRGVDGKVGLVHQSTYSAFEIVDAGANSSRWSLLIGADRKSSASRSGGPIRAFSVEFLAGRRGVDGLKYSEVEGRGWFLTRLWRGSRKDLKTKAGGRFIESPLRPVPAYHLFSVGGGETVRGYAEDRIWGNVALWERTELGFDLYAGGRYLIFHDLGVVAVAGEGEGATLLQGFGAGVRLASRIGIMKVDYAMRPGLGVLDGRVHAGWSQDF